MTDSEINNGILNILNAVCEYLDFNQGIKYVIGVGKCMSALKDAAYSYSDAVNALNYSFYLGLNTVICISDVEPKQNFVDYFKFYDEGF